MSESVDATPYEGCAHYKRKARLLAPCCGEWFGCRFCHDKVKSEDAVDRKKAHTMDRHAVRTIQCGRCETVQDAAQTCRACGITLGAYWCATCVFLDDVDKGQYHCDKCGICRVGGAEHHTHCDKCGICVKTAILESHVCLSNAARLDCSICLESLHGAREPVQYLRCGHALHGTCFRSFLESGQSTCPLCKKSVMDDGGQRRAIRMRDVELAMTPMPLEYRRKRVRVRCNDCGAESVTPFHIVGLKCRATATTATTAASTCGGSYNTVKIDEAADAMTEESVHEVNHPMPADAMDAMDAVNELFATFRTIMAEEAEESEETDETEVDESPPSDE
jgi:RING finger/CHY zinc finger protein 1